MQRVTILTAAAFLLALTLLGCDSATENLFRSKKERGPVGEELYKKLGIEKPDKITKAPDFILEHVSGERISLKNFGGKIVFLNFWATWCAPCVQEMPTMERLHREFGNKGLVILAVNYREKPEQVRQFLAQHKLTFTSLIDYDGKVLELYQVWGLPVTVIINGREQIVGKVTGSRDWHSKEAWEFFRQLLAEKS